MEAINVSGWNLWTALHMWRVEKHLIFHSKKWSLILEWASGTRINVAIVPLKHIKNISKVIWAINYASQAFF